MTILDLDDAKRHLSRLVDRVVRGETIVIAKAGKPVVRMTSADAPGTPRRTGFLAGEPRIPKDFDRMGQAEVEELFGVKEWGRGSAHGC